MSKERLSKLQKWILENSKDKELSRRDVLWFFYLDGVELEYNITKLELKEKLSKEERTKLRRLRLKLERHRKSVRLALNQLYLQKLVERKDFASGRWIDLDEQIEICISRVNKVIEETKQRINQGDADIVIRCWLNNLLSVRESYLHSKVILTKDWNKLTGRHDPGRFVFVGSEICMDVWPLIVRVKRL